MTRSVVVPRGRSRTWFAAACSAVVILASCGSSPTPPPGASAGGSPGASSPSADPAGQSPAGGASSPGITTEPDSMAKIGDAERAGRIDHPTALAYELFAALDYASLPAEYHSSNPAEPEATTILAELGEVLGQLPADLQAKVAPFFLRPDDPASFWQQRLARTASVGIRLAAFTASVEMDYVDADSAPIRVWYATPLGTSERALAVQLADEIDSSAMWDKEKTAMLGRTPCGDSSLNDNGGSGRLDIYVVYPVTGLDWGGRTSTVTRVDPDTREETVANGLTTLDGPGDNKCNGASHIIVNGSLDFAHLKSTTAHELFHAFQFSFRGSELPDHNWLSESTATWAKDLVYPEQNFEQAYLKPWWSMAGGAEGPLDKTAGTAPYAAYILPFYLVQQSGDRTGTAVGRLWEASESVAPIKAIGALPGWIDRFKEFALWNWNRDPVVKYRDAGSSIPPAMLSQTPVCMDAAIAAPCYLKLGKKDITLDLAYASVQYYEGVPDAPLIELLKFDLIDLKYRPGLGIQAILTYGSRVDVEDWTGLDERKLCVNRDDLQKIDLVVSNSNVAQDQKLRGAIHVEGLATGCSGWSGTVTATSRWNLSGTKGTSTAVFEGSWLPAPPDQPIASCQSPLPGGCVVYLPDGTIHWTWDSHQGPVPACDETRAGDFPAGAVNDPRNAGGANGVPLTTQSLVLQPNGDATFQYWGRGTWYGGMKLSCPGLHSETHPPSYFELSESASGGGAADGGGNTCDHTTWQIDAKADTIQGSCYAWNNSGSSLQYEWDLKRTGSAPTR